MATEAAASAAAERGERPVGRRRPLRLSRRSARLVAWIAGVASFASLWASIGANPKPEVVTSRPTSVRAEPKRILIKRTIRRVIVTHRVQVPAEPQIRYVTVAAAAAPVPSQPATTQTKGS
jgi:hypothetical protein